MSSFSVYVGGPSATTTLVLYDAISLVCGDGLGITFCGARTVKFYENNVEETNLVRYDTDTGIVTVQATNMG